MGIGAQGVNLPVPQINYPVQVGVSPQMPDIVGANKISLAPGQWARIPSGSYMCTAGQYSVIQWADPVMNISSPPNVWVPISTDEQNGPMRVDSDGANFRIFNPTGCILGALVTAVGSGYVAATPPTVTLSSGSGTAVAIVGGAIGGISLKTNSGTVTSGAGSGFTFGYPPLVSIASPPPGGVQASAIATLSGGQVNGFTMINQGAGYNSGAPTVTVAPHPSDPNLGSIVNCTATATITGVGGVTAILITNAGNGQYVAAPTVTVAAPSAGVTATAVGVMGLSATAFTVTSGGSGYASPVLITAVGGIVTNTPALTNPAVQQGLYLPRMPQIQGVATQSSAGTITASTQTLIDGGLFQVAPSTLVLANISAAGLGQAVGGANIALTLGNQNDTVTMQPIGGSV